MFQNIGIPGLLLIAVVVLVLFGKGKVSSLMGEVGKGITAFKKGVNDGSAEIEREKAVNETLAADPNAPQKTAEPVPGTDARNVTPPSDRV